MQHMNEPHICKRGHYYDTTGQMRSQEKTTLPVRYTATAPRRMPMRRCTPEEWRTKMLEARIRYAQKPPMPRWAEWLLIGYALACWSLYRLFRGRRM